MDYLSMCVCVCVCERERERERDKERERVTKILTLYSLLQELPVSY